MFVLFWLGCMGGESLGPDPLGDVASEQAPTAWAASSPPSQPP